MNLIISLLGLLLLQAPAPSPAAPAPATPPQGVPSQNAEPSAGAPLKYVIGPQDLLKVTVFDEAELTNSYRVDSDGYITFPLLSRVAAGGLTPNELQDRLRALLSAGFIRNPQVRVDVEQYKSQSVYVSGEVRSPGKLTMTGAMTLLEALAAAGSPTSAASSELTIAHARRPGSPEQSDPQVVLVNWKDLQLGKASDVGLEDGDIINVPKAQTFFITGQVRNGGSYVLEPGMTVQQAVALAGGLTDRGSARRITVNRIISGKSVEVSLKMEDKILAGDTIIINQRFF